MALWQAAGSLAPMIRRAIAVVLAVGSAHCGGLVDSSAFADGADASADVNAVDAPEPVVSVGRACGTTLDCADLTAAYLRTASDGKYLCGYRTEKPSPENCTRQAKTCILVPTLGRGVFYGPECGCDGRNVDINLTWPAAPAPVTSRGPCLEPATDAGSD